MNIQIRRTQGRHQGGGGGRQTEAQATFPAIPSYAERYMRLEMPPGHRFELFFPVWDKSDWKLLKDQKQKALKDVMDLKKFKPMLEEILKRQRHQAELITEDIFSIKATSTAPFLTGIGIEHPLENGFSFLKPYGLPYLPGSGVKGILRKACEEMALSGASNGAWNVIEVWALFGFEGGSAYLSGESRKKARFLKERAQALRQQFEAWLKSADIDRMLPLLIPIIKQAATSPDEKKLYTNDPRLFLDHILNKDKFRERIGNRGALVFWDVFPMPPMDSLSQDILTPHYGHYYQDKKSPHDSGQPVPNPFLTVPQQSSFHFHVQYAPTGKRDENLERKWKEMLTKAFSYAFDWLGFGAKTAVGYGQMKEVPDDVQPPELQRERAKESIPGPKSEPPRTETWETAHLTYSPGNQTVTATFQGKKATFKGDIAKLMPQALLEKLKKRKSADGRVTVEPIGKGFKIILIG